MLECNYDYVLPFVGEKSIKDYEKTVIEARRKLLEKTGAGWEYSGWVDYSALNDKELISSITKSAEEINRSSRVLVVVGIGGSYLGVKAVLSIFSDHFTEGERTEVIFAGHTLSSSYMRDLLNYLKGKDFSVNVISKSGTTTEPAIAFRLLRGLLKDRYGDDYYKRIYTTTTIGKGALFHLSVKEGYRIFPIPGDIGGRYSVLTSVGLLPFAVRGINIYEMLYGAAQASSMYKTETYLNNDALLYAAIRNLLYEKAKAIELLVFYEPKLRFFGEWYKQLFGESEGKDGKGIFPASALYTTDLHSLGQYIQDGKRNIFETTVYAKKAGAQIRISREEQDFDNLNYLAGQSMEYIGEQAFEGTVLAHVQGDVPNIIIKIPELSAFNIGYLLYFFMFSCGVSGYVLGVNPFNQEGVEAYKKNMFALLGRPGYGHLRTALYKQKK